MDLFEKQAQIHSLFQRSPVDAAYLQGTASGRKIAGSFSELDVALLLLDKVKTNEFFDFQLYFVSELSKTLETQGLDVVILNQASLLQRAEVIRTWSMFYQRDAKRRVQWEARAVMDYLEFQKYDDVQSKALAERTKSDRFAIDGEYVRARLVRLREYTQLLEDLKSIEHVKFRGEGSSNDHWRTGSSTSPTCATCSRSTASRPTSTTCTSRSRRASRTCARSPIRSSDSSERARTHELVPGHDGDDDGEA